jgi:hypothetical protein
METGVRRYAGDARVTRRDCPAIKSRPRIVPDRALLLPARPCGFSDTFMVLDHEKRLLKLITSGVDEQ